MRLQGKVALVTGSATGIGKAIAIALAQEGASVIINYSKSEEEALATVQQIRALNVGTLLYRADVSKDQEVRAMVDAAMHEFGRIDILVNNAGITRFIPFDDLEAATEDVWDLLLGVNVKGSFFCARAVAPIMKDLGEGYIINLASVAAFTGLGSSIPYVASKAAIVALTKSLSKTLAPEIRVNAIAPGFVPTRWNKGREHMHETIIKETPMGRLPLPEDMAGVVVALVTDARFVTGQTIVVDGGKI